MRHILRWLVKLYPMHWRDRYGAEFDQLLLDLHPSSGDIFNILCEATRARIHALTRPPSLVVVQPSRGTLMLFARSPIGVSMAIHAVALACISFLAFMRMPSLALDRPPVPIPPAAPLPPAAITDFRVFPQQPFTYSSLPLTNTAEDGIAPVHLVRGLGLRYPALPDIGFIEPGRKVLRRVWPGQALEGQLTRRILPDFPESSVLDRSVSVYLEYLIGTDGSVSVSRTLGPEPYAKAARTALKEWRYRPQKLHGEPLEVLTRIEFRFDGSLAFERTSP